MPNPTISESRVQECLESARFWATEIGPYAHRMRVRADTLALIAAGLSAVTGLGIWSTVTASTWWPAVVVVSLVSLTSAVVAAVPKIMKYGECAEAAAPLGPRYGSVLGKLMDALEMLRKNDPNAQACASEAVKEFEDIRAAKEALKPYPAALEEQAKRLRAGQAASPHLTGDAKVSSDLGAAAGR
jgi:hypothetical protein